MRTGGFFTIFLFVLYGFLGAPRAGGDDKDFAPAVAAASEEGRAAIARMQLMKDCNVSLVAAEPRLANPVSFAISNNGDFFVAETFRLHKGVTDVRNHMDWCDDDLAARTVDDRVHLYKKHDKNNFADYSKAPDRVRWLRDTDGDGAADVDKIFATDFRDAASGVGAGLLVNKDSVYYTCIPDLWLLTDKDRDGVAEERKILQHGYGVHIAMIGHDLHGLRIGPDGKLYFSCGDRGLNVETKDATVEWPEAGAVLRCNLDGSELEIFARGLRNPQELVFDEFGNLFTGDNNSDGGDRARWVHVIEGADYGWRYGYQWIGDPHLRGPWNEEKLWHPHFAGQAAYIVPPVSWLGSGPSGLTYYPGTGLGAEYKNHFFLVEFEGDPAWSGIFTFTLKPKGASYELGPVEKFLWGALPTDCDFGPDGSLYFTDWVHGWEMTGKGRIYKITHSAMKDNTEVAEVQNLLKEGFEKRPVEELSKLLGHADQRIRQNAQFELVAKGAAGAAALEQAALRGENPSARRHGIWGLGMAARAKIWNNENIILQLLSDGDADVRMQSARSCGELKLQKSSGKLVELLHDENAPVRLAACLALSKLKFNAAVDALFLLACATGEDDPALRHGVASALAGCASSEQLIQRTNHNDPNARIAAVVALRLKKNEGVGAFLKDNDPRVAVEAARAIYDSPIGSLYNSLADCLQDEKLTNMPTLRRALGAALRIGTEKSAQDTAQFAARPSAPEAARMEALDHLYHWNSPSGRDAVMGEWRPIFRSQTQLQDSQLYLPKVISEIVTKDFQQFPEAVQIAGLRLIEKYKIIALEKVAADCLQDTKRSPKLRGESLKILIALNTKDLPDRLRGALVDPALDVRTAALGAICKIAPAEALGAAKTALAQGSAAELRIAYDILAAEPGDEANRIFNDLLERYENGLMPDETRLDFLEAASKKFKDHISIKLPSRKNITNIDEALAPWLDALHGGDAATGRSIFRNNNSVSCLRCHKTGDDDPGAVGPDLRGLSLRSTRLQILESIVEPNRKITNGYQSTIFELNNNTVISGRVESEDAKIIKLRKPDNTLTDLPAADIKERRADLSAMPEGLSKFLTKQEMRDLIEFLATLK